MLCDIDWLGLPPNTQAAIRRLGPLLIDGYSRRAQARMLGVSEEAVAADERLIRDGIAAQLFDRVDALPADAQDVVLGHVDKLTRPK
jgi:hypothetical protein